MVMIDGGDGLCTVTILGGITLVETFTTVDGGNLNVLVGPGIITVLVTGGIVVLRTTVEGGYSIW